jgi:hypothetical protein
MHIFDMSMQRAFEFPLTQLTVNQAAGVAVNAATAAVQPAKASHARSKANVVLDHNYSDWHHLQLPGCQK